MHRTNFAPVLHGISTMRPVSAGKAQWQMNANDKIPFEGNRDAIKYIQWMKEKDMCLIRCSVFRHQLDLQLVKTVRPPTRRHLGRRVRQVDAFPTTMPLWKELTSQARGLPFEDKDSGISRSGYGAQANWAVEPRKETASRRLYKIKLQNQVEINKLMSLHHILPGRAISATRIMTKKDGSGGRYQLAAMAAGPVTLKLNEPLGVAAFKRIPALSMTMNIVTMDEQNNVTFGVVDYPPWMKR